MQGDVAVFPVRDGFGAAQVTEAGVWALDWYSAEPPTLADLTGIGPLLLDDGRPAEIVLTTTEPAPPDWQWLGRAPLPADRPAFDGRVSAGWTSLPKLVRLRRRWDVEVPEPAKNEYRAAATRGPIEVDFGAGPVTLGAATSRLDLTGTGPIPVPGDGPVRWSALDRLPRCSGLIWSGADRGLTAALATRPVVSGLLWHDPPPRIDLRGTHLTDLRLTSSSALEFIRLPPGLDSLDLLPATRVTRVDAAEDGRWLRLSLAAGEMPQGLSAVRDLIVAGSGTIRATFLAGRPDLRRLHLSWQSAPGELTGLPALAALSELTLRDGYGVDAGTLPELPALARLSVHGLRRTAVAGFQSRYRGTGVHLELTGAKNDTWLAANLTNPFRDWADDDPRAGAAACKAYAQAVRALARPAADAETVLHDLVRQLNRIDARHQFIDTVRREEAGDAFLDLAARAGVPTDRADEWFDEWRDF